MRPSAQTQKLAAEFSRIVRRDLTKQEMAEVVKRNRSAKYARTGMCATHEFMDANMTMDEAWRKMFGHGINLDDAHQVGLWNAAWDVARKSKFTLGAEGPRT